MDKSNKKKNIAVFVKNLTSGGAEKQAVLLAKVLQYDYDMHFVIFNGDKMHRKYLDMLENANVQEINKAILILRELSADEHMRQIAEMREKALHDEASAINSAIKKGRAEGMAEGMAKGIEMERRNTVFRMFKRGDDYQSIIDLTNVPYETIDEWYKEYIAQTNQK